MSNIKLRLKKNDKVIVIAGKDKGKQGIVLKVIKEERKLLVEGVNQVKRHSKPSMKTQGGVISKEMPIAISNVAYLDPKEEKPTKIGYKILEDGKKVRFAKLSGEIID
ncbi:MAG: 50S ribosomal protein L24 [Alphaproteobacteria bacterium]|jgi:large subunit ribosomal protein L24